MSPPDSPLAKVAFGTMNLLSSVSKSAPMSTDCEVASGFSLKSANASSSDDSGALLITPGPPNRHDRQDLLDRWLSHYPLSRRRRQTPESSLVMADKACGSPLPVSYLPPICKLRLYMSTMMSTQFRSNCGIFQARQGLKDHHRF